MPHMCAAQNQHLRTIRPGLAVALTFSFLLLSFSFLRTSLASWLSLAGLEVGVDNLGGINFKMQKENHALDLCPEVSGGGRGLGVRIAQAPTANHASHARSISRESPSTQHHPPLNSWSRPLLEFCHPQPAGKRGGRMLCTSPCPASLIHPRIVFVCFWLKKCWFLKSLAFQTECASTCQGADCMVPNRARRWQRKLEFWLSCLLLDAA